jgi:large conductance mechanosensitive channel
MGMMSEFKEFAMKGNVMDMAVGIVIGGAFTKIVNSLVSDVIMPGVSPLMGKMGEIAKLGIKIQEKAEGQEEIVLRYGAFVNNIVDFLIVAFCVFIVIKYMNKLKDLSSVIKPKASS